MESSHDRSSAAKILSSLSTITTSVIAAGATNTGNIYNPIVNGPTFNLIMPKNDPPLAFDYFIQIVRTHYLQNNLIKSDLIKPSAGLKIDQVIVNVAIVEKTQQAKKEKEALTMPDEKKLGYDETKTLFYGKGISSFEEIYGAKKSINPDSLFKGKSEVDQASDIHRILLYGRAGIGKSTLLLTMAYRWAKGELWSNEPFKVVILLGLKELTNANIYKGEQANIAYAVWRRFGLGNLGISVSAVQNMLKENADKILYLADGFDEVAAMAQEKEEDKTEQGDLIRDVINQKHLFLSSRPYFIDSYCSAQGCGFDLKVENIGFLDSDIDIYIERYFGVENEDIAKRLRGYLQRHAPIRGIAHIPIMLGLICSIWRTFAKEIENLTHITMSMLYQMLIIDISSKQGIKFSAAAFDSTGDFLDDLEKYPVLCALAEIAFLQMQEKGLIIHRTKISFVLKRYAKSISEEELFKQVLSLGLIKAVDEDETREDRKDYYFVHLSLQEFLASIFVTLALLNKKELLLWKTKGQNELIRAEKFISEHKYILRYEIMWWFVSGLLKDNLNGLEYYFDLLESEPKDLIGLNQQLLLTRCLEECNLAIGPNRIDHILTTLSYWLEIQMSFNQMVLHEYLRLCPKTFAHFTKTSKFQQYLQSKNTQEFHYILYVLSYQTMLPVEIVNQVLEIFRNGLVTGNMPHHINIILINNKAYTQAFLSQIANTFINEEISKVINKLQYLAYLIMLPELVIQKLFTYLKESWQEGIRAASILSAQSRFNKNILSGLINKIADNDYFVRSNSEKALSERKDLPKFAIMQLFELMTANSKNDDIQQSVIRILRNQNSILKFVNNHLVFLLRNNDFSTCYEVETVLSSQKTLPNSIILSLIEILIIPKIEDFRKENIIKILTEQKTFDLEVLKQLSCFLKIYEIYEFLRNYLSKHEDIPMKIYEILFDLLYSDDTEIQGRAGLILKYVKKLPEPIYCKLNNILVTANVRLRVIIANIFEEYIALPEVNVRVIVELLKTDVRWNKSVAACVLSKQSKLPDDIREQFNVLLDGDDLDIKLIAIKVLKKHDLYPTIVLEQLEKIKSSDYTARMNISHSILSLLEREKDLLFLESIFLALLDYAAGDNAHPADWLKISSLLRKHSESVALSETSIRKLVDLLNHKTHDIAQLAWHSLITQKHLPENMVIELIESLLNNHGQNNLLSILIVQTQFTTNALQKLVACFKNTTLKKELRISAIQVLSRQTLLPDNILQELRFLLADAHDDIKTKVAAILCKQEHLTDIALCELANLLNHSVSVGRSIISLLAQRNKLPELIVLKILSFQQKDLESNFGFGRDIDENLSKHFICYSSALIQLGKMLSSYSNQYSKFIFYIQDVSMSSIVKKMVEVNQEDFEALCMLIFIKCIKEKVPIYIIDNSLYIEKESLVIPLSPEVKDCLTVSMRNMLYKVISGHVMEKQPQLPLVSQAGKGMDNTTSNPNTSFRFA